MSGQGRNPSGLQRLIDGPRIKRARCGCVVDKDLRLVREACTIASALREVRESAQRCYLIHVHDLGEHHPLTERMDGIRQRTKDMADDHHTTAVSFGALHN